MAVRLMAGRLEYVLAAAAMLAVQDGFGVVRAQESVAAVSFDREIRPILSDSCFTCHGPDEAQRSSGLRLDQRDGLFSERSGGRVVSPGNVEASLLLQRILSADPDLQMPPPESQRHLTDGQKQLLSRWIQQGAKWSEHWAFVRPQAQAPPRTGNPGWCRNPIDQFVLARLESAGLRPATEADRRTLIRRVSLDLTGLPPKLSEVEAFVADESPDAWERVVDGLLASQAYGEHMAVAWLDAARYADTSGYQNDGPRSMWRWRDWVIEAFNRNLPFDQFTVEQIAGDLLEEPTLEQRIATGFNRNHRGNAEGGIIPEEYQVEYVADRVDTTFAVWQGLTMGCARCHDHKYDPLSQREYYQVFAWFNNLPESGRAIKEGNSPPLLKAPLPAQQRQLRELEQRVAEAEQRIRELQPELSSAVERWSFTAEARGEPDWVLTDGLQQAYRLSGSLESDGGQLLTLSPAGVEPQWTAWSGRQAILLDGGGMLESSGAGAFGYFDRFTLSAWIRPEAGSGTVLSRMIPVEQGEGYSVHLQDGRVQVNLVKRWLDDAIRVESESVLPAGQWVHLAVVYDGSRLATGIHLYVNGVDVPLAVRLDRLNQTFAVKAEPFRVGGGHSRFRGAVSEVRIYGRDLSSEEVQLLAVSESVAEIAGRGVGERNVGQRRKLETVWLERHADVVLRGVFERLPALRRQQRELDDQIPTVMVMQELPTPRETRVLQRGQYDRPGELVQPGVPAAFAGNFAGRHGNRLDLARWLVSGENPLTARVAVNRFWQRYFEFGLVRTTEDFGSQGEAPVYPELLDWLALEFQRIGWDMKALQRLIVTSATYRQSSRQSSELLAIDPDNRLLARGARRRLSAEVVRDQALSLSGLLTRSIGGPSVKPYQPEGLWKEIATDMEYEQSRGADLYRRSLYTYWKRTVAPPLMVTFDAASREACTVSRGRTNTPLQALALLNDVTFLEAARVLAQRELQAEAKSAVERIERMFCAVTLRLPTARELEILCARYERNVEVYRRQPEAALALIRAGESGVPETLNAGELAAFTTVASVLLNLDEVITRE